MDEEKYRRLYPELKKSSDLGRVLNESLVTVGSLLRAKKPVSEFSEHAYIRGKSRDVLVGTEWGRRQFYFWCSKKNEKDVVKGSTDSLLLLAGVIHQLLELKRKATEVQREFPWVELPKSLGAEALDAVAVVEEAWEELEEECRKGHIFAPMYPLVMLARQHPLLGKLYPFTSLYSLQFSLCTEYPFDSPCPGIWCGEDGMGADCYIIEDFVPHIDFGGDFRAALEFVVGQLPVGCGAARLGAMEE